MKRPISKSRLETYFLCAALYWYLYMSGLPKSTDFPRMMGIAVHRFVGKMHAYHGNDRPFYYKSRKSASSAWFGFYWKRIISEFEGSIKDFSEDKVEKYGKLGWFCINNYWELMEDRPKPLEVEKRYSHTLSPGVSLLGIIDQVRSITLAQVEKLRPELIVNGALKEGYSPHILVDIKTGMYDYDPARVNHGNHMENGRDLIAQKVADSLSVTVDEVASVIEELVDSRRLYIRENNRELPDLEDPDVLRDVVRLQAQLHLDIQITMYTYLYEQVKGFKPVGFYWYNINTGGSFFTFREDEDYEDLMVQVAYFTDNVQTESFPKRPGKHCRGCDYLKACRGNRPLLISLPTAVPVGSPLISVQNYEETPAADKQLKMDLKIPREKREAPKLDVKSPPIEKGVRILEESG